MVADGHRPFPEVKVVGRRDEEAPRPFFVAEILVKRSVVQRDDAMIIFSYLDDSLEVDENPVDFKWLQV